MCYRPQVHNLLRVICTQHCVTCLSACINIRMISKNRKCMTCYSSCRDMNNTWKQLSRHFIHIRNHKQKALRSRICCCKSSCRQRTMHGTGNTCFRLHLCNFNWLTKKIFFASNRIFVCFICHNR